MSPERFLLDTSALLTLIEDEPGAQRVEQAIASGDALLPWPALLEAYYISRREHGQAEADRRYAFARQMNAKVLWHMDEPILLTAGWLKAEHRLSFADAVIAAYALRQGAILLHKDPEFEALAGLLPMEALSYKDAE